MTFGRRAGSASATALIGAVFLAIGGCSAAGTTLGGPSSSAGAFEYRLYVANESSDLVSRVVFDAVGGARVEREIAIGIMPADTDGPHGVAVSPDGAFLYVTVAHGTPDGWIWKFRTGVDTVEARTTLGRFPASLAPTPDGQLLFVANFDLHGDPVPSDLSVVYAPDLAELTRIATCVTPHGSRVNASGTLHYSACMRSDQLVEVSLATFAVATRFSLRPGAEGVLPTDDLGESQGAGAGPACSPTWVTPGVGASAGRVYVTCNAADQVLELDPGQWTVTRRFDTGRGPYNLEVTPDGRHLIVTLRGGQAVEVFDLNTGEQLASLQTSRSFTHGIAVDPNGQYAFVTNEAVGSVRGTLDVFDLGTFELVASVELQHQPGGIAFWRVDPIGRGPAIGAGD